MLEASYVSFGTIPSSISIWDTAIQYSETFPQHFVGRPCSQPIFLLVLWCSSVPVSCIVGFPFKKLSISHLHGQRPDSGKCDWTFTIEHQKSIDVHVD